MENGPPSKRHKKKADERDKDEAPAEVVIVLDDEGEEEEVVEVRAPQYHSFDGWKVSATISWPYGVARALAFNPLHPKVFAAVGANAVHFLSLHSVGSLSV